MFGIPENKIFEISPLIHNTIMYATPLVMIGYAVIEIINKKRNLNK